MSEENKKLILPKNLQVQMLNFFMKTSIKRSVKEKNPLSKKELDKGK